jgi:hypothetical protein
MPRKNCGDAKQIGRGNRWPDAFALLAHGFQALKGKAK